MAADSPRLLTADLPGIGGRIKARADDFEVTEIPLYEWSGSGEHVHFEIRRSGRTTRDVEKALARLFEVPDRDVGVAGLKDKEARATQRFSLPLSGTTPEAAAERIRAELGLEVLGAARHGNKLRTGHLLGNRFRVVVRDPVADWHPRAEAKLRMLAATGAPNWFGEQRFGADGENAARGRAILRGARERNRWLRRLMVSAWQSELFNRWLDRRIADGLFDRLVDGDVAKRSDRGGLFLVADPTAEEPRLRAREISPTGPLFGAEMMAASGEEARREAEVLADDGIGMDELERAGLPGDRRRARLDVPSIRVEVEEGGDPAFVFTLPKGAFATSLMQEILLGGEYPPR